MSGICDVCDQDYSECKCPDNMRWRDLEEKLPTPGALCEMETFRGFTAYYTPKNKEGHWVMPDQEKNEQVYWRPVPGAAKFKGYK